METVVIFNMGRDAARAGVERIAPENVMYPIRSIYVPDHEVEANLSLSLQKAWLDGFDHFAVRNWA